MLDTGKSEHCWLHSEHCWLHSRHFLFVEVGFRCLMTSRLQSQFYHMKHGCLHCWHKKPTTQTMREWRGPFSERGKKPGNYMPRKWKTAVWSVGETRQGSELPPEQPGTAAPFEFTTMDLSGPYENAKCELCSVAWPPEPYTLMWWVTIWRISAGLPEVHFTEGIPQETVVRPWH